MDDYLIFFKISGMVPIGQWSRLDRVEAKCVEFCPDGVFKEIY
jgi:NAD-dependent dihydropyrimidine dehydrogenase PreA subunit